MEQTDKQILVQVVDLIKQGQNKQAVNILAELLGRQPKLEQGWYLLGIALDDPKRKRFAFERVLKLNPDSDRAKQQLLKLEDVSLPKPPAPIDVAAPPSAPLPPIETPEISTPWMLPEEEEEPEEVELPDWARDIPDTQEDTAPISSFEPVSSTWTWEDEYPDVYPDLVAQERVEPSPFTDTQEVAEEPEPEDKPKRKLWFRKREAETPTSDSVGDADASEEDKPRRKTRKEKKAEKLAQKEQAAQEKEKSLQEQLLEGAPKPRRRIYWRPRRGTILLILFLFICGGLGGAGYYYRDTLIPLVTQYAPTVIAFLTPETTPTPDYTSTPTFTPAVQPTLPPTWTPAGTQIGSVLIPTLPDLSINPTITPTPEPMDPDIIVQMQTVEDQMQALRELNRLVEVDREMMPTSSFRSYMQALALSRYDMEEIAREQIALEAFGFVANEYYHVEVMMNDFADFVGGFFYPEQNKIYLPGAGFYGLEQYIYSYEYGLAMLNRNFDIYSEFCQGTIDSCLAESALVAGDVAFTQNLWLQTYPIDFDPEEFFNLEDPAPLFQDYWAPAYFDMYRNFDVKFGPLFVEHLYGQNGWQTINYTYRYPPETSEQVLHPEKYDSREARVLLYDPDILPGLGEGWQLVERETLGEWRTYLLLAVPDYPDAVRPEEEAAAAAAGWGGDTYQIYTNPESGAVVMSAHWNWDTAEDKEEFFTSFVTSQAGRFQNAQFDGPGEGSCWTVENAYSCLYQNNRDVLWIYSTDQAALEITKDVFGQFD